LSDKRIEFENQLADCDNLIRLADEKIHEKTQTNFKELASHYGEDEATLQKVGWEING